MALEPGTITRGLTEYIFCCWVCNWRESIPAMRKINAMKKARHIGWFLVDGKWRCLGHEPPNKQLKRTDKAAQPDIDSESAA